MADAGEVKTGEELDDEQQARRQMALAQIRQYGDPALRMRALEVDSFDDDLARLAGRMTSLMREAHGVGLAGNQAGILRRVVVIQPSGEDEARTLVNPRIVGRSEEVVTDDEGCLSLQGVLVPVERSLRVEVDAQDVAGAPVRLELEEMGARVIQHEVDHLDGVLIIDKTTPESRREAMAVLRPRLVLG